MNKHEHTFYQLPSIDSEQVGFFKKEARRSQHHYFHIVYRLLVLIDLYTCKRTRSIYTE